MAKSRQFFNAVIATMHSSSRSTDEDEEESSKIDEHLGDGLDNGAAIEIAAAQKGVGIQEPKTWDILCGRGKSTSHPGNQRFRQVILSRRQEYQQSLRRDDKTRITHEIAESLRNGPDPSRFLIKDASTELWYDVGDHYAREKISHALRSRPSQERPRQVRLKQRKTRKSNISDDQEQTVQRIIGSQQQMLQQMIERELYPAGTEAPSYLWNNT